MRAAVALVLLIAGPRTPAEQAEQLAARAVAEASSQPAQCLADASKALVLTADFEPTAYVKAGRKGEVVEDAYLAARVEFRKHRAGLYKAMGACLAASNRHDAAARYLRRSFDLDPTGGAALPLARSLVRLGRGRDAIDVVLAGGAQVLSPEALAVVAEGADAIGLPSVQTEIDRVRIAALPIEPKPELRDGPVALPDHTSLSTGRPLQLEEAGVWLFYVPQPACRSCSADLESLKQLERPGVHVVLVPPAQDQDQALRGVVSLYRYTWPYAAGSRVAQSLNVNAPAVVLVARNGFLAVVVRPPLSVTLPAILEALKRSDAQESVPRTQWNHRAVERRAAAAKPKLLPGGFAPGEDEPAPPEFDAALAAFRAGRPAEALRMFETLGSRGDGWLLLPEARLDRALCLAALGRREEARRLLLSTGDSRFQDDLDRALEEVGSSGKR